MFVGLPQTSYVKCETLEMLLEISCINYHSIPCYCLFSFIYNSYLEVISGTCTIVILFVQMRLYSSRRGLIRCLPLEKVSFIYMHVLPFFYLFFIIWCNFVVSFWKFFLALKSRWHVHFVSTAPVCGENRLSIREMKNIRLVLYLYSYIRCLYRPVKVWF